MSFGTKHLESMKANRPELYRMLECRGELPAVLAEVQERASKRLLAESDAREKALNDAHPERKGYLNRAQAMTEAEGEVMREIVLVPALDNESKSRIRL